MKLEDNQFFKEIISGKYKCRNSEEEKHDFYKDLKEHYGDYHIEQVQFTACIKTKSIPFSSCKIPSNNILLGDFEKALVVITAHYDTPSVSQEKCEAPKVRLVYDPFDWKDFLRCLAITMAISIICYLFHPQFLLLGIIPQSAIIFISILILPFGISFVKRYFSRKKRVYPNQNNANDNSAAVCLALYFLKKHPDKVAVILFDQEENERQGSKYMKNKFKNSPYNEKLFINLDVIGCTNYIVLTNKSSKSNPSSNLVKPEIIYKSKLPTDFKYLPCKRKIDIATCNGNRKKKKSLNYGYIHSIGDTKIDSDMIDNIMRILEYFIQQ